jgi:hypothetical protein
MCDPSRPGYLLIAIWNEHGATLLHAPGAYRAADCNLRKSGRHFEPPSFARQAGRRRPHFNTEKLPMISS